MVNNLTKSVLLVPDLIYDQTVGEMGVDEIYNTFNEYKTLEDISGVLSSNSIFSINISESIFDYITNAIRVDEGMVNLSTYLHLFKNERKMVLCIRSGVFLSMLKNYIATLKDHKAGLFNEINTINTELLYLGRLMKGLDNVDSKSEDLEVSATACELTPRY